MRCLPSDVWEGHPESAGLTGFTAEYIIRQMADFKSERERTPRDERDCKGLSDEKHDSQRMVRRIETHRLDQSDGSRHGPEDFRSQGRMRFALAAGGTEPIGNRIITLPQDQSKATRRDPHSGSSPTYLPAASQRAKR